MTRRPHESVPSQVVDPVPSSAPVQDIDPAPAVDTTNVSTVDEPSERTARRRRAEQVGETYVVAWPKVSLFVEADEDGEYPDSVILGDGRKAAVVDAHVVLLRGTPLAATSLAELEQYRSLASLGALSAAAAL